MFSIRKLFGRDDKFFDLLEASAQESRQSILELMKVLRSPERGPAMDELIQHQKAEKRITEEIREELCKTFVTPLEREDIDALSTALSKIPKIVKKFGQRFVISHHYYREMEFERHAALIEQASETVEQMVKALRGGANLEEIKKQNDRLQYLEGEADKHMLALVKDLFTTQTDPMKVLALEDLYELLEKMIDRCRDAGTVVFHIVLKYS